MGPTGFDDDEVAFIRSQPLVRMATLGPDEQPDVVPLACEFDGEFFWIGGGETFVLTRKVRNIVAGRRRVALIFDDLPSFDPFIARSLRVYGVADDPVERDGIPALDGTSGSCRRSRGAGIWRVNPSARSGTRPGIASIGSDMTLR